MSDQDNGVAKKMREIYRQTGKLPSLVPYLSDPETFNEASEIWQDWGKTCEKITEHWRQQHE